MPLINCKISLILACFADCVKSNAANQATTFAIIDPKFCVQLMTMQNYCNNENQDSNAQLTGINVNQKQQHRVLQTNILIFLIEPSFQEAYRLFVLTFNANDTRIHSKYFLATAIVEDYNVTIDGRNFSYQPIKNDIKTNENIQKIPANRGDDYTTSSTQQLFQKNIMKS